jgi:hypothetical protein
VPRFNAGFAEKSEFVSARVTVPSRPFPPAARLDPMPPRSRRFLVSLLFAVSAGWLLHRLAPVATAPPSSVSAELAALRAENARLQAEFAARPATPPASDAGSPPPDGAALVARLRLLRDWVSEQQVYLGTAVLTADGKLSGQLVALFGIGPAERATLETVTTGAQQELARLSLDRATVGRDPDGHYFVQVPAFIAEGRPIYERVSRAFETVLGPEKGPLFLALLGDRLEPAFGMFGAQERTLTLSTRTSSDGRIQLFDLQERRNWAAKT